ncbi:CDP-glycerol glycerophosphotransferase OS=Castellaniella defragrans OX=75697 GN=HNR28_002886 PE=3 SV=1 [Castellaniella denitrificans]
MNGFYFYLRRLFWRCADFLIRKDANCWAFATHHIRTGEFIENQRAVFEHMKSDATVRKIVFYRGKLSDPGVEDAVGYEFVRHGTLRGLLLLARCKVVFITHSISMDFSLRWGARSFLVLPIATRNRVVVNLSHGVSIKRLLYTSNKAMLAYHDRVAYRGAERRGYAGMLAASDVDGYVMASMYYPLNYHQIWTTGIPRHDFLVMEEAHLPAYVRQSVTRIREVARGRRLVVYAPTYRQTNVSPTAYYYQFRHDEIERLEAVLKVHGAVLGYRPHYFKNSSDYFNMGEYVDGETILDLSQAVVPDVSALIRECEAVITDYSSVYTEALYLGKPGLCFAYDLEEYNQNQDGLLYDPDLIFSNRVFRNFDALLAGLDACLRRPPETAGQSGLTRRLFFRFDDDRNARRVCDRVKAHLRLMEG